MVTPPPAHRADSETDADVGPLTVLYDGGCPLCRREIGHARRLAAGRGGAGLDFVDIAAGACPLPDAPPQPALLARFHVRRADGRWLSGAEAFAAMWARLPGWRWLAWIARRPGMLQVLERAYAGFLRVRPALQRLAARLDRD
jgi:predicted DCC family thiol-disulfide oxidoreductase YuxK